MKPTRISSRLRALFAGGFLITCPGVSFAAAAPAAPPAQNEQSVKLPLEASFAKEKAGDNTGLSTLTLKNTSTRAVKFSGSVELSVVVHNRDKTRSIPAQVVEPGKTAKVEGLSSHDKITLNGEGFAALRLNVP